MAYYAIDPDVARIAKRFGVDARLIQAVVRSEGDILKAVRCSLPSTADREEAIEITCRSAAHAMSDYLRVVNPKGFVEFWAQRWAPQGVANDPTHLNRHWPVNVLKLWVPGLVHPPSIGHDVPGGGAI